MKEKNIEPYDGKIVFNSLSNTLINQVENVFGLQWRYLCRIYANLPFEQKRNGLRLSTFNTQQSLARI